MDDGCLVTVALAGYEGHRAMGGGGGWTRTAIPSRPPHPLTSNLSSQGPRWKSAVVARPLPPLELRLPLLHERPLPLLRILRVRNRLLYQCL